MQAEYAPVILQKAVLGGQELDLSQLYVTLPAGKLQGDVCIELKSGCTYEGEMVDGRLEGHGRLTFPDGQEYTGSFVNNKIQGKGVYKWPGGAVYDGEVQDGLRHGHGRMTFTDCPVVYEGSWYKGRRQGQGKMTFNIERSHWYEGDWEDDTKQGTGTMQYANGDVYIGLWANDVKCGHGVMHWHSSKERYEGQWRNNKPNGPGTHVWLQQMVQEPSAANHALLLLFNRYCGFFKDGKRHGYGVMYYATGARYEGCWDMDLKQGPGTMVYENGEVWQGAFSNDQPVLSEGEVFAPKSQGLCLQIQDLTDEEEVPAAAARGVANVLMVYNTDLRSLYDKYCKRPSLHLDLSRQRSSFTMVSCQVWELLGDVRLITSATPLARVNQVLAKSRRPPSVLAAFRAAQRSAFFRAASAGNTNLDSSSTSAQECCVEWWDSLDNEHVHEGVHGPMQELLFREFVEFLVRLAALRYRHLPNLERRLHTLINVHLLHQVSKTKTTLPPPPRTPFHLEMWSGNATSLLHASQGVLERSWDLIIPDGNATESAGVAGQFPFSSRPHTTASSLSMSSTQVFKASTPCGDKTVRHAAPFPGDALHNQVKSVRSALQMLQRLSLLSNPAEALQAAAALTFNYLTINTYTYEPNRAQVVPDDPTATAEPAQPGTDTGVAGAQDNALDDGNAKPAAGGVAQLADTEVREVLCWLDQPMLYVDWVEGIARIAQSLIPVTTTSDSADGGNADGGGAAGTGPEATEAGMNQAEAAAGNDTMEEGDSGVGQGAVKSADSKPSLIAAAAQQRTGLQRQVAEFLTRVSHAMNSASSSA